MHPNNVWVRAITVPEILAEAGQLRDAVNFHLRAPAVHARIRAPVRGEEKHEHSAVEGLLDDIINLREVGVVDGGEVVAVEERDLAVSVGPGG